MALWTLGFASEIANGPNAQTPAVFEHALRIKCVLGVRQEVSRVRAVGSATSRSLDRMNAQLGFVRQRVSAHVHCSATIKGGKEARESA